MQCDSGPAIASDGDQPPACLRPPVPRQLRINVVSTMKTLQFVALWVLSTSCAMAEGLADEARYLGLLPGLQFVETPQDLKKLIPDCPPPKADAGEGNTEIVVKTKPFGCEAQGEFPFHPGILVSHGFEVRAAHYRDAHRTFSQAIALLHEQVKNLKLSAALPIALGGTEASDGPADANNLNVDGAHRNASFQLRLDMRPDSVVVRWAAQKADLPEKKPLDPGAPSSGGKPAHRVRAVGAPPNRARTRPTAPDPSLSRSLPRPISHPSHPSHPPLPRPRLHGLPAA